MLKTYRKAIVAIIINSDKNILIGYSPRDASYKLPQGGVEIGETPIQTAKRELFEELHYNLAAKKSLFC